jgi:hypothetical protein
MDKCDVHTFHVCFAHLAIALQLYTTHINKKNNSLLYTNIMKLFYIGENGCHDIKKITSGVKRAYQLEQEFKPYLSVEFFSNKQYKEGIFFIINNDVIHKKYFLYNDNELKEIRGIIWKHFTKYYNVTDITKNGCISKFTQIGKNSVNIGWTQIKNNGINNKIVIPDIMYLDDTKTVNYNILHSVYKNNGDDIQDKKLCMINRIKECTDNYPLNSQLYKLCNDNVVWLCKNGYPNIRTKIMSNLVKQQVEESLTYLKNNNMNTDKNHYDDMILSGFFERPANRMGNKYSNLSGKHAINFIADKNNEYYYYSNLIEGFGYNKCFIIILIFVCIILCYIYMY